MKGGIGWGDALAGSWALKLSRYSCPSFPAVFSCMRRFCTVATPFTRGSSVEYTLPASAGISSIPSEDEFTVMTTFPFKFHQIDCQTYPTRKKPVRVHSSIPTQANQSAVD